MHLFFRTHTSFLLHCHDQFQFVLEEIILPNLNTFCTDLVILLTREVWGFVCFTVIIMIIFIKASSQKNHSVRCKGSAGGAGLFPWERGKSQQHLLCARNCGGPFLKHDWNHVWNIHYYFHLQIKKPRLEESSDLPCVTQGLVRRAAWAKAHTVPPGRSGHDGVALQWGCCHYCRQVEFTWNDKLLKNQLCCSIK